MLKQKAYLLPENLVQLKNENIGSGAFCVVVSGSYLFQLIVRLHPDFNCCNSFALSSVDKVTTGT